MSCSYKVMPSPVGKLTLVAREDALAAILWEQERLGRVRLGNMIESTGNRSLASVERQLNEYFAGERVRFDVALHFEGTDFQKAVWKALLDIPYGETRTYGDIAALINRPNAVRAVGAANGRNPVSIIAPCHRVIAASGELTGFAEGLPAKATLLTLEGARWGATRKGSATDSTISDERSIHKCATPRLVAVHPAQLVSVVTGNVVRANVRRASMPGHVAGLHPIRIDCHPH